MQSVYMVEHLSAMERREALTLATTWTDPENTMLSERSQTQDTQRVIPLMGNVQNRQIHRDSGLLVVRGWGGDVGDCWWGWASFWGDGMFWN